MIEADRVPRVGAGMTAAEASVVRWGVDVVPVAAGGWGSDVNC